MKEDGDRLGTMDFKRFHDKWFLPQVALFSAVKQSKTVEESKAKFVKPGEKLSDDDVADLKELEPLSGRTAIFSMDGTAYHKKGNPDFVQREGAGGLFGADCVGRWSNEPGTGWTKGKCIQYLFLLGYGNTRKDAMKTIAGERLLEDHEAWMQTEDLHDLRHRVDEEASHIRWMLHQLALDAGLRFLWTPPCVGKLLNMIEILWSITKGRLRKLLTKKDRATDASIIAALEKALSDICQEKLLLNNICLPTMRVAFAVLKAVFRGERVMHKKKPVLFAELFTACQEFGDDLRSCEADENSDRGALPSGIPLEMPDSLVLDGLPRKVGDVFAEDEEGATLFSTGKLEKLFEEMRARDDQLKANMRRTKRAPPSGADADMKVGDWVHYCSKSAGKILYARIEGFNPNGTIRIDKKPEAQRGNISIPYRAAPEPALPKRLRKTKRDKANDALELRCCSSPTKVTLMASQVKRAKAEKTLIMMIWSSTGSLTRGVRLLPGNGAILRMNGSSLSAGQATPWNSSVPTIG